MTRYWSLSNSLHYVFSSYESLYSNANYEVNQDCTYNCVHFSSEALELQKGLEANDETVENFPPVPNYVLTLHSKSMFLL